jgi:hypothetical protein
MVKSLRSVLFFFTFALFLCRFALAADAAVERTYSFPGHGMLVLHLPAGWEDQLRKSAGDAPPTIVLSGFEGTPFVVKITLLWPTPGTAADFGTPKSMYDIVVNAARAAEKQSVEGRLDIVTMGGGRGPGFYFDATDRAPKPGDFKYMTQGAVSLGQLACTFTILSNDAKLVVKNKTLTMLGEAGWRPRK